MNIQWNKLIVGALHLAAGAMIKHGWVHASVMHWLGGAVMAVIAYFAHNPAPDEIKQDVTKFGVKLQAALLLGLLMLSSPAMAQTTNASSNPIVVALQNTIVDTNSTFWANEKLELRATTQSTLNRLESVLGASYYFSTNGGFGVGGEVVNGSLNVIDSAYATAEYAYVYYNLKFVVFTGFGYDLVDRSGAIEIGGRLQVALSKNMFADTEALWQSNFKDLAGANSAGTFRVGIGWRF